MMNKVLMVLGLALALLWSPETAVAGSADPITHIYGTWTCANRGGGTYVEQYSRGNVYRLGGVQGEWRWVDRSINALRVNWRGSEGRFMAYMSSRNTLVVVSNSTWIATTCSRVTRR